MSLNTAIEMVAPSVRVEVVLGDDSSSHLYRGIASPDPIGVVIRSFVEPSLFAVARLSLHFRGATHECQAKLHWTTQAGAHESWLGFRLINPSAALRVALARIAVEYPTRLYDEWTVPADLHALGTHEVACPSTRRSLQPTVRDDSQQLSGQFAVAPPVSSRNFGELLGSRRGMTIANAENDGETLDR